VVKIRVTALYGYDGLKRVEIDEAGPGTSSRWPDCVGDDRRDDFRRRNAAPLPPITSTSRRSR
jgi:hypothetical protein